MSTTDLIIGGMTCASCAARVEKKLNKLDGVTATVNFATETASVTFPAAMPADELISVVEQAGYTATLPPSRQDEPADTGDDGSAEADLLLRRLLISLTLAIPVAVLAMVPALQFRNWQWASLALASPVAVWGAWPFHRAAVVNARHGAATMDTLISLGVAAAYLWSLYALFFGGAGHIGDRMTFSWLAEGDRDLQVGGVGAAAVREPGEAHPHAGPPRGAEDQRTQRPQVRGGDPDRDQRVHGGRAVAGADQGGAVERPRPPDRDRGGQH